MSRAVIDLCARLHISVIAEGVETLEEAVALRELGVAAKILERDSSANGAADLTGERRLARHMLVIHT